MTKKINGGTKGLDERKEFYHKAIKVLSEGK
jgi:predicted chitinase